MYATVPAENLVRIQNIDVGPIPLLSSSSYVHFVCIHLRRSLLLHPDSGGFTIEVVALRHQINVLGRSQRGALA